MSMLKKTKAFFSSKLFFYFLLISFPFQIRKIFFTSHSFYNGYNSFYNTFYLYLTDIVIFGLILGWFLENNDFSAEKSLFHRIVTRISQDIYYRSLLSFWLILAISVVFSRENFLGLYGLFKIAEFFGLFAYIRENIRFSHENSLSYIPFWLMLLSLFAQAIFGIWQYLIQSSIGLKFLGEEYLRAGLKGVASFYSHGAVNSIFYDLFSYLRAASLETLNMRAYGTLPHPNVLGGLLFFGLIINIFFLHERKLGFQLKIIFLSLSLATIITGIIVTFSRLVWVASSAAIFLWFLAIFVRIRRQAREAISSGVLKVHQIQYFPDRLAYIALILLASLAINFWLFGQQIKDRLIGSGLQNIAQEESVVGRQEFNKIAVAMIKRNPFFGVGLKNFVIEMDNYLKGERLLPFQHQPVHNIYLLVAAESGIIGLVILVLFLFNIVRPGSRGLIGFLLGKNQTLLPGGHASGEGSLIRYTLLIIFFGFLFLGLFDHYLWTIQQGSLIFWITLGFLASKKEPTVLM